jgi:hypothetical protein
VVAEGRLRDRRARQEVDIGAGASAMATESSGSRGTRRNPSARCSSASCLESADGERKSLLLVNKRRVRRHELGFRLGWNSCAC